MNPLHLLSRYSIKCPSLLLSPFIKDYKNGIYFLTYHRVTGDLPLELDIPFELYKKQILYLKKYYSVISYTNAVNYLKNGTIPEIPSFVITFDDGYEDNYSKVFHFMQEYDLPFTVYVTTGFIENIISNPLSKPVNYKIKPLTWDMIGEMLESGIFTLGGHTHTHPQLPTLSPDEIEKELLLPLEIFKERLGATVEHFAYPKGKVDEKVEEITRKYYTTSVIVGGKKASSNGLNYYRIPRLMIRKSDGWLFYKMKVKGYMEGEEVLYKLLRIAASR